MCFGPNTSLALGCIVCLCVNNLKQQQQKNKIKYFCNLYRCTQIKMYSWDNAQVVLVGNKMDLEEERVITTDRGKHLAEQLGTVP